MGRDFSIVFLLASTSWDFPTDADLKQGGKTRARSPQPHNPTESVNRCSLTLDPQLPAVSDPPRPASRTKRIPHLAPVQGGDGRTIPSIKIFHGCYFSHLPLQSVLEMLFDFFSSNFVLMIFAPKKKVKPNTWIFFSCKTCLKNKKRPVDPWIYTSVCQAVDLQFFFSFPLISFIVPVCNSKHGGWVQTLQLSTVDSVWRILAAAHHPNLDHRWRPKLKARSPTKCDRFAPRQRGEGGPFFQRLAIQQRNPRNAGLGRYSGVDVRITHDRILVGYFWATWNNSSSRNPIKSPSLIHPPYKMFQIRGHKNHILASKS